jgi:hypothetical protein
VLRTNSSRRKPFELWMRKKAQYPCLWLARFELLISINPESRVDAILASRQSRFAPEANSIEGIVPDPAGHPDCRNW